MVTNQMLTDPMFTETIGNSFPRSFVQKAAVVHSSAKPIAKAILIFGGFLAACFTQIASAQSTLNSPTSLELPATMRKTIVAGVTPVGTVVQAKLEVATLVDGVVVPENAILSGEVTESAAKSASAPSRLAIRMDSAHWKQHGAPQVLTLTKKVYLTAWSYPAAPSSIPDPLYQPSTDLPSGRAMTRLGSPAPITRRLPDPDDGSETPASKRSDSTTASNAAPHRVPMKDVESTRARDGAVRLTSRHSNIKLDKSTTYVFAGSELASGPV
ncbi:MAG TPA: hypothetical protein VK828_00750 [Terriglobales bacterium]|jgi:hypothetical protein|nr:hypothetical protein [Terriglobales bacterium]